MNPFNFFSIHTHRMQAKERSPVMRQAFKIAYLAVLGISVVAFVYMGIKHNPLAFFIPTQCANSISCVTDLSGGFKSNAPGQFMGESVALANPEPEQTDVENILGTSIGEKHIYVDLATQTLTAYEGSKLIYTYPVATGKWGRTPTGDFHIWVKLKYTHMEGGSKEDNTYYNLYNVPYTMFFYNDNVAKSAGFSIHGAYWHNNFGHPMSHGCVNLSIPDSEWMYNWASVGTLVNVHY